jgi:uncharacterized protein (TIGR02145 family)
VGSTIFYIAITVRMNLTKKINMHAQSSSAKVLYQFMIGVIMLLLTITGCDHNPDSTVTDVDGNVYKTAKIGDQVWMTENLKVTHYRNGTALLNITDNTEWSNAATGAYCNYNNDTSHVKDYGRLYNWYAVVDEQNIAPAGWHIPSPEEITTLMLYLKGDTVAGAKMKERGTTHWLNANKDATNESGFLALPGGYRFSEGTFHTLGSNGYWWSGGRSYELYAWSPRLYTYFADIGRDFRNQNLGLSIRCVKD